MNVYATDKIRNVVLLGHGGAGKTSLLEAMAFLSGITTRLGNVADGTTLSDFDKEEQNRKFSISTSMAPIIWNGVKINVLDTPGYFDFVGEVEEAVAAADAAIIVVNGKSGVVSAALWKSKQFQKIVRGMVGDSLAYGDWKLGKRQEGLAAPE